MSYPAGEESSCWGVLDELSRRGGEFLMSYPAGEGGVLHELSRTGGEFLMSCPAGEESF